MIKKGRYKNGRTKLTKKQVDEIRMLYSTGLWRQKDLATKFKIVQSQIGEIVNYKSWV